MATEKGNIIARLQEIDTELKTLYTVTNKMSRNWVTEEPRFSQIRTAKDPYRIRSLQAERIGLLKRLDEISEGEALRWKEQPVNGPDLDLDAQATQRGADMYMQQFKPKFKHQVTKNRTIPAMIIDETFRDLGKLDRDRKIDALRARIYLEVKKRLKR